MLSKTILVVEDNPGVLEVAKRILVFGGYSVLTAEDGQIALELLSTLEKPVDLLLTDLKMPRMGGLELADAVGGATPIAFMTGFRSSADTAARLDTTRGRLLKKPFAARDLLAFVEKALAA